jgi:hypothetical protein
MLDDNENNAHHTHTDVEAVRDTALRAFHMFLEKMCEEELPPMTEYMSAFLSTQETINIIKEHCNIFTEDEFGIGADSEDEYKKKMMKMMHALGERIMSNVLHSGVQRGLLDAEYDIDKGAFAFSITEKGKNFGKLLDEISRNADNAGNDQSEN